MIIRKVKVTEYEYQAPINYVAGATEPDIQFQLTDYEIPSGATGRVYVGRSDGTFEYTVATISGNNVTVAPTSSMFSVKGPGAIQVTLYVGNEVVKNFAVPVYVHADLADDSAEAGSDVTGVFRAAEEEALADFQEQAEEIAEEVKESIPEDYTELTEEVEQLNERIDNLHPITDDIKVALLACFENVAWINAQGQTYYDNLEAALYADEYPKITATFAPGSNTIYTDDAINDLKQYLTVKYYATKRSTGVVVASNDYTLSGTLVEGENVVRVEYNNLSTTFIVNAVDYYNQPYWSVSDGNLDIALGSFSNIKFNNHELWWNMDGETPAEAYIYNFRLIYAKRGEYIYREQSNMHPIPIPSGAKTVSVTITPSTAYIRALPCYCVNNQWFNTGTWGSIAWGQGVCNANIPTFDVPLYLIVYCKHESAGNGGSPFPEGEPSEITVTFGFEEGE